MTITYPDRFLCVRFHAPKPLPATVGLCAGYEGEEWRSDRFADHLFQWLPYVALSQESQLAFGTHNFVEMLRVAAAHIYRTKKTTSRGEIGELILHISCIQHYGTIPVICKLILKTSSNDTVKGFDGVHLLQTTNDFELWLGESKFYLNPQDAIREAVKSIRDHILPSFLTTEKAMLFGHVGTDVPHREEIIRLFKSQTSGDELLAKSVFPVLIAYESVSVASHKILSDLYVNALKEEVDALRDYFSEKASGINLRFELIFVPMKSKTSLVDAFDRLLESFL